MDHLQIDFDLFVYFVFMIIKDFLLIFHFLIQLIIINQDYLFQFDILNTSSFWDCFNWINQEIIHSLVSIFFNNFES